MSTKAVSPYVRAILMYTYVEELNVPKWPYWKEKLNFADWEFLKYVNCNFVEMIWEKRILQLLANQVLWNRDLFGIFLLPKGSLVVHVQNYTFVDAVVWWKCVCPLVCSVSHSVHSYLLLSRYAATAATSHLMVSFSYVNWTLAAWTMKITIQNQ